VDPALQYRETRDQGQVNLRGSRDPVIAENDKLQEIMNKMRQVELQVEEESKNAARASVSQSPSKAGLGVTESMMIDAVADVFLKEMQNMRSSQTNPLEQSFEYRRIGEDVILDKIKGILDEVAGTSTSQMFDVRSSQQ
jgi:hypothetical protein